ncbi:MAG: cytochrome b5 [Chloroflexi bacterium]|nr:cytochrome b5 [Chloroflexota bacterium]
MNIPEKEITLSQLMRHNGDDEEAKWIAYEGVVYDVTDCPNWRKEMHRNLHFPGIDLSGELEDAPHADDVFTRPCVKIVGKLAQ